MGRPLPIEAPKWRAFVVPVLYAIVALATFRQYGLTWDEPVQHRYGELVLHSFAGRSGDVRALADLRYYGPFFEVIAAAAARILPMPWYDARHLCTVVAGILTVVGVGRFAAQCGGNALAAQLALLLMPQFYGHSFNNSKDVPFACAAVWIFLAFARIGEGSRWPRIFVAGAVLGVAMSIRFGALLLLGVAALAVVRNRESFLRTAAAAVVAWCVMIVFWPWAREAPLAHPLEALRFATHFPQVYPLLFEGAILRSDALPRRYLLEMLAFTTPVATLLLALAGLVIAARRRDLHQRLLVLWLTLPLAGFVILRPNVYDGIRHFLFLLPAIAICASIALALLPRFSAAALLLPIPAMVSLHPYESTYYNVLAGGTGAASTRFETDYWASSYREAALWVRNHRVAGRTTRVLVAATPSSAACFAAYLPETGFEVAATMAHGLGGAMPFDDYVATTRYRLDGNFPQTPVVDVVERDGAVFCVIRSNHPISR